jgi:hypothetical protein
MPKETNEITIKELEAKIFLEEHIRVVFRIDQNHFVPDYPFKYSVGDKNFYLTFHDRIEKTYPNIDFIAIDGHGMPIERRGRKLSEIRETYAGLNV